MLLPLLLFVFSTLGNSLAGKAVMTIAFGQNYFETQGAIVTVDIETASWEILGTFQWPDKVKNNNPYFYDPTITVDRKSGLIYFSFQSLAGFTATLDPSLPKIIDSHQSSDIFWVGFTNMRNDHQSHLIGVSPVGNHHGEFSFGRLDLPLDKEYFNMSLIPFKGDMDDTAHYDESTQMYYTQASYDQREKKCAPVDSDLCMLQINSKTGQLVDAVFTNWTMYHLYDGQVSRRPDGSVEMLGWIEGFPDLCKHPYNDFLFAQVNLHTGKARPVACLDHSVSIQEDEWIAAFTPDGTKLATASRWSDDTQFLVLDTATGKALVQSSLKGISQKLGAKLGLFYIWSLDFLP